MEEGLGIRVQDRVVAGRQQGLGERGLFLGIGCQPAGWKVSPGSSTLFLKGQVLNPVCMALRAQMVGNDSG
jgi:hypothetical protein